MTSAASSGPNQLIKQRFASLITNASDVIALRDADQGTSRTMTRPQVCREFSQRRQTPDLRGCSF